MSPQSLPLLNLHLLAMPAEARPCGSIVVHGQALELVEGCNAAVPPIPRTFEAVVGQLMELDRLYIEWDGSFVWCGKSSGEPSDSVWQLDGMLYDDGAAVRRLELRGSCPWIEWTQVLHALAPTDTPLVAYLQEQQCFVQVSSLKQLWRPSELPAT
ncbi:hypothetical protein [Aureliella helgolandensis]|uniref:Uncharacterized protein n=1 Tax=Aureliella helgolandensis TaxID=2527968 RepID=A0A518GF40_9BACT|nr:hypothetical protein [Aureliella helgolandensis]QDV27215.1 hypothetical protein Q31a_56030 [Aureliella helgolandensis]